MSALGVNLPLLFGPYELLVRLGHGGMGQVFLGRRTTMAGGDSVCVVKTLKPELAEDSEYVGRFLDEVRTVMQLRHSSISHVFDAGLLDDAYYMAMEHLAGVTARDLWQRAKQKQLDVGLALLVMEDVLGALAYAHAFKSPLSGEHLSVVHRDVSPHNVIVTFEGEVKLIDFGLAESVLKQEHTESHVVMGKISYMSPEQARGESVSGACDQFAAAVMLYELVSGERFYGDRNNSEIWTVVGFGGFRPDRFRALSHELREILDRALAKDAAARFPDCGAFRAALEALHAKSYPLATRSKLRSFMQESFAEAQRKQQQELRRSAIVANEVEQHTQSVSRRASSPSLTTELTSELTRERTTTERIANAERSSVSQSLRVQGRSPARWIAGLAVVVFIAVGSWFVLRSKPEGEAVPVKAIAAARTSDVAPVVEVAPAPAPVTTKQEPAGVIAKDDDETARPPAAQRRPEREARARPARAASVPEPSPAPNDAPAMESPPARAPEQAAPPAKLTNAEALDIVRSCKSACAASVLALPNVKDGSIVKDAKPNALLLYCADKCR